MKLINFINPLAVKRMLELRTWALITACLMVSICIGILIITIAQWHIHRTIRGHCAALQKELTQISPKNEPGSVSKSEYEKLKKKVAKLSQYANCPKNPLEFVTTIRKASGNAPLQSLSITKKKIELQAVCTHAKQATSIVKNLSESKLLQNVQLISLHATANNQLTATISAERVKKIT